VSRQPGALHPRLSVNSVSSLNWSLSRDLELWQELGIQRAVVQMAKIEAAGSECAMNAIRGSGIGVESVLANPAFTLGEPGLWDRERGALRHVLDTAHALGAVSVYMTTGPAAAKMTTDDAIEAFLAAIAPVLPYGAAMGMTIAVEHSSTMSRDWGCIHSLADLLAVSRESGIAAVAELQNCWLERGLPGLFRGGISHLALVQVSDYVIGTGERLSRACPGDGDMPLKWLLQELLEAGYSGVFDLELLGPRIEREGYVSVIRRAVGWLSEALWELGA